MKGHHLRDILPPLPEKPLKSMTDHRDPQFIQDRQSKLELYIASLVAIPHVSEMICVKAFLGLMDHVSKILLCQMTLSSLSSPPEIDRSESIAFRSMYQC